MKLNLGCSDGKRDGFLGVDRCPPADIVVDLSAPWPWADSSIEEIYAKDVFEHVDNSDWRGNRGKIWVLNESWRILKPGGRLEFLVPCVMLSDGTVNPGAFADPTHVSFWTPDDHYYFCEQWAGPGDERGRLGPAYGVTALFREIRWEVQEYGRSFERRSKLRAIWEAIK